VRTKNFTEIYRIRSPDFSIAKAENISFISGNHKVGDVIPIDHSRNTLILTTWRSGSTFLGDLLNQYPGTFYYFEPLHYYGNTIGVKKQSEQEFLDSLFKCKFNPQKILDTYSM